MAARKWIILAVLGLFLLIALLPLRLALGWSGIARDGISARSVSGTIWSGSIKGLQLGKLPLGDLDASLNPFAMLLGKGEIALNRPLNDISATPSSLKLARWGSGLSVSDASGEVLIANALEPLPVRSLNLQDVNVRFSEQACQNASGTVQVQLEQNVLGFSLQRGLTGNLRCDGAALLIPLKGQSGLEQLDLRVKSDGSYAGEFILQGVTGTVATGLALAGFQTRGDNMVLTIDGTF